MSTRQPSSPHGSLPSRASSRRAKRRVAVITSSRADYSHLYWPLREMESREDLEVLLIAIGPHLSPEFGTTVDAIEGDGFRVDYRVESLLSSDSDVGMAKSIGVATQSLADILGRERPDLVLVIADRYEMLAPASVALALRIPLVHIEGERRVRARSIMRCETRSP